MYAFPEKWQQNRFDPPSGKGIGAGSRLDAGFDTFHLMTYYLRQSRRPIDNSLMILVITAQNPPAPKIEEDPLQPLLPSRSMADRLPAGCLPWMTDKLVCPAVIDWAWAVSGIMQVLL